MAGILLPGYLWWDIFGRDILTPHRVVYLLGEDQFGFRRNRGTREAFLALQIFVEIKIISIKIYLQVTFFYF